VLATIRPGFWLVLCAGCCLCLVALPLGAARVDGMYQAEVEFGASREEAFRAALGEVLVRITGRRDILQREETGALLESAQAYAQQFRQPAPDRLWVAFDGAALERELTRAGLPVWGAERPSTLLWIAVDAGGGRRFVVAAGTETPEEAIIQEQARAAAGRRGLPLVFPLMDSEDRERASFAEVWGGFEDSILAASERYGVDAVLVGRLAADDPGHGRWTLLGAESMQRWTGGLPDSVDRVADLFAARFAVVPSGESRAVRLVVGGLQSMEDYGRVSRFLAGLTAVEALGVESLEDDQAVFRVALRGEPAALDEAVRLGGLLRPDGPTGSRDLIYRVTQ
jgi:uncharacterized protein